ncbi:MAG: AMP-binding protein [Psychromonas sp.]|nr:AMP-binding protein [Psychromonas sp.]
MFTPWLQSYPEDIPFTISEPDFTSLVDLFENSFKQFSSNCAFINMDKKLSYQQLDLRSQRVATYLQQSLKLKQGDRVAIMMPNLLQYPIIMVGILRAGLVVVNINPLYTATELKHQLKDSGAKAIFILTNFASTLEQVVDDSAIEHVVLTEIADELTLIKRSVVNFAINHIKKMVPKFRSPGALSYREILRLGNKGQYIRPVIKSSDIAFLQYTGGTTGESKGSILTHANMIASLQQADSFFGTTVKYPNNTVVTALPLYHAFALTVNGLYFLKKGGNNILITNPRDINTFIKTLKKHPFTYFTGLNTLFNALLHNPAIKMVDFSKLKITLAGGMATHESVATQWKQVTGCSIIEGYGLTECSPLVSVNLPNSTTFNRSIGLPLPSTNIRLSRDDGTFVSQNNEPGEIEIKGPQVMAGYWNNQLETDKVLIDGWLKSGDIAQFDDQGFLHIVDRKKDMILVSGFNVYPNEIEAVVAKFEAVLESAAIGIKDEQTGEKVKLFVVLKDHSATIENIKQHCKQYLTAYKRPKLIEIVTELPKNNVGKVLRRRLKEH